MRPYPRPFFKSSRVRHFAAGLGAATVLVALFAASGVTPKRTSEGIMDLSVDVRDVPCDVPFDEDERVQVIPDTLNGRIGVQVVVRNRQCCCCEADTRLGELRMSQPSAPTEVRPTEVKPASLRRPAPEPEVSSVMPLAPEAPLAPLAARPGTPAGFGTPADVAGPVASASRARLPWWLALAATPAAFLFGSDSNDVCEDDETGATSGPSRTCDADEEFRRAQARVPYQNAS